MATPNIDTLIKKYKLTAQKLAELKANMKKAEQTETKLKAMMEKLEIQVLGAMNEAGTKAWLGKNGSAKVASKEVYTATDWAKVWAYAKKNDAPDLFQKRLNQAAIAERYGQEDLKGAVKKTTLRKVKIA